MDWVRLLRRVEKNAYLHDTTGGKRPLCGISCRAARLGAKREFIHLELVGDAAQGCLTLDRGNPAVRQDRCAARIGYNGPAREDRLRQGQVLHAGGDVHGLPEIVLTFVEHHGQARALVDADLQEEVLAFTRGV